MDALKGATITVISGLLLGVLLAYSFRLPVPLSGMLGPLGEFSPYGIGVAEVFKSVFAAWLFYEISGGFII